MKKEEIIKKLSSININNLNVTNGTKLMLIRNGIYTIGDLLKVDYSYLYRIRGMGSDRLIKLKEAVHELGVELKNEYALETEILAQKRKENIKMLDKYGLSPEVYLTLYSKGIYTMEDVCNYGSSLLDIKGFGPLRKKELTEKMTELGVEFNDQNKALLEYLKSNKRQTVNDKIEETEDSNTQIKNRISEKQMLIESYKSLLKLIEEQKELNIKEKELDTEIINLKNKIKEKVKDK